MLKLLFLPLAIIVAPKLFSQPVVIIEQNQISRPFYQASGGSITFPVEITVKYNGVGIAVDFPLQFQTVHSTNTSLFANNQVLTANPPSIPATDFGKIVKSKKVTVNVTMNAIQQLNASEFFDIILTGAQSGDPFVRVTVENTATSEKKSNTDSSKKKDSTSIWNNITFLNAANFDFSDNLSGSYLGKLNIFSPDIKKSPWGFNAGIMRIKFNYKDSSNSTYSAENRFIHPLDSVKQGAKYLRQYNKYTSTRSNTVWSFYVQPMFRLLSWPWPKTNAPGNERPSKRFLPNSVLPSGIYLHLHGELLVNKTNITTSITPLQQDTALMDTTKRLNYVSYIPNPLIFDRTYLNGYFGAGITVNVDPFGNGNSRFFFQATFGITTDYPNWVNQDISSTTISVVQTRSGTTILQSGIRPVKTKNFFLVRSEFAQVLSSNAEIIVGTDIRGLGKYNPLYATYVGLNVNMDALAKILSDKGK